MSHGVVSGGAIKAEPNLVPLLDVVLQLIMFFMLTVRFVSSDQNDQRVKLPESQASVLPGKDTRAVTVVNVAQNRALPTVSGKQLDTDSKIVAYLIQQRQEAERRLGAIPEGGIRADRGNNWGFVAHLMRLFKEAGYTKVRFIVMSKPP
jgi:biopolymer transport protein ExbD